MASHGHGAMRDRLVSLFIRNWPREKHLSPMADRTVALDRIGRRQVTAANFCSTDDWIWLMYSSISSRVTRNNLAVILMWKVLVQAMEEALRMRSHRTTYS